MTPPVLVQFRSSHYNEKARWALDYKRIPHTRRTLLPGFHTGAARKLSGTTEVPVLVRDGEVTADSTRIIAALEQSHPEPPLYPEDLDDRERALALEDFFDEQVGPAVRHAMFFHSVPHPDFVASLFAGHRGAVFRRVYAGMLGMRRRQLAAEMNLVPDAYARSCELIEAGWSRLESEIQPSGYLVGDRFSVADLTAASLLAIVVFPPEFPHPPVIEPPATVRAFWDSYAGRPGAAWVREMYGKHRGESAAISGV